MDQQESPDFSSVKARLDEIVDEISQEGVSLDDALALYEEAVKLGLAACDLSEADIMPPDGDADLAVDLDEMMSVAESTPLDAASVASDVNGDVASSSDESDEDGSVR